MAERVLVPTQIGQGDHYYTYMELLAISQRFKQNSNELMVTWILRVYDQGGPALSLNSGSRGCRVTTPMMPSLTTTARLCWGLAAAGLASALGILPAF